MAWRIFSWFPPAASFFPLRALSLCTSIKMALNRVQRHGEILSAKSCGMCVSDTAHVKCIEIFQFKCICLSLGLRVECEPEPDCQHYPVRGLQCSAGMRSECSFSRMSWSYYARPRWMRGVDLVVITLSPHQQCYSGLRWGGHGVWLARKPRSIWSHDHSVQSSESWLLSLWFEEFNGGPQFNLNLC